MPKGIYPRTEEHNRNISEALKGKFKSREAIEKMKINLKKHFNLLDETEEEKKIRINNYKQKWRMNNLEKHREISRNWNKLHKEQIRIKSREWRINHQGYTREYLLNNPEIQKKAKIYWFVHHHIKIPKNQLCEICNKNLAIDRHHEDYNKPLEIIFCCRDCHALLDRERRKREENKLKILEN